jgi:hypothetical protein
MDNKGIIYDERDRHYIIGLISWQGYKTEMAWANVARLCTVTMTRGKATLLVASTLDSWYSSMHYFMFLYITQNFLHLENCIVCLMEQFTQVKCCVTQVASVLETSKLELKKCVF